MGLTTTKRFTFQSTHRLEDLGEQMHGHHFYVEVTLKDGEIEALDEVVHATILPELHGRNLSNLFAKPTGENLVQWIHETLLKSPLRSKVVAVTLEETKKNRFTSSMTPSRYV